MLDAMLGAALAELDLTCTTVIIISDHGNLEDLSVKTHTLNPVPGLLIGAGAARLARAIRSLLDVTPAIVDYLSGRRNFGGSAMNERSLRVLEYPKIVKLLSDLTSFPPGKELAERLSPLTDLASVEHALTETDEAVACWDGAVRICSRERGTSGTRSAELRWEASCLRRSCWTWPRRRPLFDGHGACCCTTRAKHRRWPPTPPACIRSWMLRTRWPPASGMTGRCWTKPVRSWHGCAPASVRASSQPGAAGSRHAGRRRGETCCKIRSSPCATGATSFPVKQDHQAAVPGIVHDTSASGATVFIEPMPVVELNNQISEARGRRGARSRAHFARTQRTSRRAVADGLLAARSGAGGTRSHLRQGAPGSGHEGGKGRDERSRLDSRPGREAPAADGETSSLSTSGSGGDFRTLVITGPNTGGKTVTLKTIGLFCLDGAGGVVRAGLDPAPNWRCSGAFSPTSATSRASSKV